MAHKTFEEHETPSSVYDSQILLLIRVPLHESLVRVFSVTRGEVLRETDGERDMTIAIPCDNCKELSLVSFDLFSFVSLHFWFVNVRQLTLFFLIYPIFLDNQVPFPLLTYGIVSNMHAYDVFAFDLEK